MIRKAPDISFTDKTAADVWGLLIKLIMSTYACRIPRMQCSHENAIMAN